MRRRERPILPSDHCGRTWSKFDELLGAAVAAEILVEEEILDLHSKGVIVGYALVQIKVGIDDLLDHLLDLVVEGQAHVFARIHSGALRHRARRL